MITRTTDTIVDSIYERYDPTMREHPWEGYGGPGKEGEINIRVREFIREYHQEMRGFDKDVEALVKFLQTKHSDETIEEAISLLGEGKVYRSNPKMRQLKPSMLFVVKALRRFLHPPVDPVHVGRKTGIRSVNT